MNKPKIKKGDNLYLCKYALSEGIKSEIAASDVDDNDLIPLESYGRFVYFKIGRDVFESMQQAVDASELMRIKKVKSLEKSLAAMKSLKFSV
jgi:hypothetical protein